MQPPTFRKLRCQAGDVVGAWRLGGPWWWPYSQAVRDEFRGYVDSLRSLWPRQFLFVEGDEGHSRWRELRVGESPWEVQEIDLGHWALLLFDAGMGSLAAAQTLEVFTTDAEGLAALRRIQAKGLVLAGPDDIDWELLLVS
jgi:hypothetical protein